MWGKDLGSVWLDPISCLCQEAMTSLTLQRHLLLWAHTQQDRGIEDLGINSRTNKSRLQQNTHQILIRRESLLLSLPVLCLQGPQPPPLIPPPVTVCSSDWRSCEEYSFSCAFGYWQPFPPRTTLQNVQWTVWTGLLITFEFFSSFLFQQRCKLYNYFFFFCR